MTLKQFTAIKLVVVILLALVVSQSVVWRNYIWPIIAIVIATLALLYLRTRVKEVMADERDYQIGGQAARWAIQIYGWLASLAMIILYAKQDLNPGFLPVAYTLAYSVCLLLIIYALIFRFQHKFVWRKGRTLYAALGVLIFLALLVIGLRFFSGEDDWICQNGQWIKHGQPDFPAPTIECTK